MKSRNLASIILFFSLCLTAISQAQETHHSEPVGSSRGGDEFSWNVSVAIDIIGETPFIVGGNQDDEFDYLDFSLLLDVYYRGFFIQSNRHRYSSYVNGGEIGYELEVNENYEVDLISKGYLPGFSSVYAGFTGTYDGEAIEELKGINSRDEISLTGIRYMRYLGDTVYWVDVAGDFFSNTHSGWVVDSFYSYILQKRNWDINLGIGASFFSNKMNSYYFSVAPEEVKESRPVYHAGSGYRVQAEAFFQRPISESWIFNGGVTVSHYSKSISDSPLVSNNNVVRAQLGATYVF